MLYRATITNREVVLDKVGFHQHSVGKDALRLLLDEEWDGAEFTVVTFYRGRASRGTSEICGQRLWTGEDVDIPAAALTEAGELRITVTGIWPDGSSIVTCEMEDGADVCWSGADSVDYEVDPGKDAIAQLADMVQTANAAAVAAKEAAQSAEAIADAGYLPDGGAEGQWLRKNADDSEWADLPAETDPTVPEWAKAATKPSYTAAEVGADPAGSAEAAKAEAMAAVDSLSKRVDLVANSDDETLDQLAEFAEFVKANREAIETLDPLPKGGMDGDVLTLVDGVPAWAEPQGGSGGGWTEDEVLAAVVACGLVTPVGDAAGNIYTDGDGAVFSL